jgi:hypothetical protein
MMIGSVSLLISGCAKITSDSYCDVAFPLYFEDQEAIRSLEEHDYELMVDVLVHNETYEKLCD